VCFWEGNKITLVKEGHLFAGWHDPGRLPKACGTWPTPALKGSGRGRPPQAGTQGVRRAQHEWICLMNYLILKTMNMQLNKV